MSILSQIGCWFSPKINLAASYFLQATFEEKGRLAHFKGNIFRIDPR